MKPVHPVWQLVGLRGLPAFAALLQPLNVTPDEGLALQAGVQACRQNRDNGDKEPSDLRMGGTGSGLA